MTTHSVDCWKSVSLAQLGVGGPLASCTCGADSSDWVQRYEEACQRSAKFAVEAMRRKAERDEARAYARALLRLERAQYAHDVLGEDPWMDEVAEAYNALSPELRRAIEE